MNLDSLPFLPPDRIARCSLLAFLACAGAGLLLFMPMAAAGLAYRVMGLFIAGLAAAGVCWLVAAAMGLHCAALLARERHRAH
jgi:hypothetical protein